jgi:hypothetical protein
MARPLLFWQIDEEQTNESAPGKMPDQRPLSAKKTAQKGDPVTRRVNANAEHHHRQAV